MNNDYLDKEQGTRHKEQGTRHKIQELLTTHSNLAVTINPKFEFRNPNLQHPASNIQHPASSIQHPASSIQHPTSNLKPQTSNFKLQPPTSLSPQRFHRIGNGRLYCLRTDRYKCNKDRNCCCYNKNPPPDIDAINKILQPFIHGPPCNGKSNQ